MLRLVAISKKYGSRLLFKGLDLHLEAGSITLLAGSNGAGKSTLLRIIAGLSRPDSGTVACELPQEKIGFLGHPTFLYPGLTALENLEFWAKLLGLKPTEQSLLQALTQVNLARYAEERAGIFSRGMAQRLNLARLLLPEPSLLLLDEPGTGLDAPSRALLYSSIAAASQRGASVLWISHDVAEDSQRAHRVLWLTKTGLHENPPESETAAFSPVDRLPGTRTGSAPGIFSEAQPC